MAMEHDTWTMHSFMVSCLGLVKVTLMIIALTQSLTNSYNLLGIKSETMWLIVGCTVGYAFFLIIFYGIILCTDFYRYVRAYLTSLLGADLVATLCYFIPTFASSYVALYTILWLFPIGPATYALAFLGLDLHTEKKIAFWLGLIARLISMVIESLPTVLSMMAGISIPSILGSMCLCFGAVKRGGEE